MALKSGLSVAIMSAVLVSQLILQTHAQTRATRPITFDCNPEHLHGAARLTCLAKRFEEGRRLFDEETFHGNGRTCLTCHSARTGTFSPEDAQKRLAANPGDPLFVGDGLDDGVVGTSRITEHATVRIDIPLPPRVNLANDPAATRVTLIRGTPTTRNTPSLQPLFMYDGRDLTLEAQALGAVHAHARPAFEPTPLQLELIAEFQRTSPRFFSSLPLFLFARGGPAPGLRRASPPLRNGAERCSTTFRSLQARPEGCAPCVTAARCSTSPTSSTSFCRISPGCDSSVSVCPSATRSTGRLTSSSWTVPTGSSRPIPVRVYDPPDPNEFPPELFVPAGRFRSSSRATSSRRRHSGA